MPFSERDKLKALAIVHIFETSRPFGDYSAVAVLNDGAGISYGINQFTHRSGSLFVVLQRFVKLGGKLPYSVEQVWDSLQSGQNISIVSQKAQVKADLRRIGQEALMQQAQREIAFEKYLEPALEACKGDDFELPLTLAVIYDSINHGSFTRIRDKVVVNRPGNASMKPEEYEREWITRYTKKRDAWLESVQRLAATDYRTDFFLAQIARSNWNLNLPLNVHGFKLTDATIDAMLSKNEFKDLSDTEIESATDIPTTSTVPEDSAESRLSLSDPSDAVDPAPVMGEAPQGEQPVTETGKTSWLSVEDWKPFCFKWLKRIWAGISGVNFTQGATFVAAAAKDPPNWFLYVAIAIGILFATGCAALIPTGILFAVWYFNRKEINSALMLSAQTLVDPKRGNLGVKVEKE